MLIVRECQLECFSWSLGDAKSLRISMHSVNWKGNVQDVCTCQWSSRHLSLIFHLLVTGELHIVLGFNVGKYISDSRREKMLVRIQS